MICQQKDCGGEVDREIQSKSVEGHGSWVKLTSPCKKCGLLHSRFTGDPFQKKLGKHPFLIENKIVYEKLN